MFPISITFTVTTLEQADAVREALEGLARLAKPESTQDSTKAEPKPVEKARPAQTAPTQPTAEAGEGAAQGNITTAASGITPPADASDAKPVTYADLQAAVLKLHKADATAAKPIATAMGYDNFKAMPEDKWPEALVKVRLALAERGL
jgi:hypothetical protein